MWKATPLCIFWLVWKERNNIVFKNGDFSIQRLKNSFVCRLWNWSKGCIDVDSLPLINYCFRWVLDEGR